MKYFSFSEHGYWDIKSDPFTAVTTPVTAHDRHNEYGSFGFQGKWNRNLKRSYHSKKLKSLTGIFYQICVSFVFSTMTSHSTLFLIMSPILNEVLTEYCPIELLCEQDMS